VLTVKEGRKFDWAALTMEECATGNALDASYTLRVYDELRDKLVANGTLPVLDKLLSPLFPVFADIEYRGLDVSLDELGVVGRTLNQLLMDIEDELYVSNKVAKTANLMSTKDLMDILYSGDGFGFYPPVMTDKGNPSTNKQSLDTLLTQIDEELEKRGKKK
tara:strand:+ start:135 stop:620 length:486 start_codon:yes stop_codon:yes gene_type:complete